MRAPYGSVQGMSRLSCGGDGTPLLKEPVVVGPFAGAVGGDLLQRFVNSTQVSSPSADSSASSLVIVVVFGWSIDCCNLRRCRLPRYILRSREMSHITLKMFKKP